MILWDTPRVTRWLVNVFGRGALINVEERALRFGEESLELIQSLGVTQHQAEALVKQVYAKPPGDQEQELGGTTVTLAALCAITGLDADRAYRTELNRVHQPAVIAKIKAKHATKAVVSAEYRG